MQSYVGYRAIGDFAKYNQALLTKYFKLPSEKMPSYSTIRRILMGLDWSELLDIFNEWAKEEYHDKEGLEWIAVDGKCLRNTVINHDEATQNFVMFASFWEHIKNHIKVERYGEKEGEEYYHSAYYISSLLGNAQTFAQKIRGHWKIENQLHWVKDVIFREDTLPLTDFQAVSNLSILQTIALNLFRGLGFLSITKGQRWLDNRWFRLCDLLE
jgi:predicted transposase YbfD/YdcC